MNLLQENGEQLTSNPPKTWSDDRQFKGSHGITKIMRQPFAIIYQKETRYCLALPIYKFLGQPAASMGNFRYTPCT